MGGWVDQAAAGVGADGRGAVGREHFQGQQGWQRFFLDCRSVSSKLRGDLHALWILCLAVYSWPCECFASLDPFPVPFQQRELTCCFVLQYSVQTLKEDTILYRAGSTLPITLHLCYAFSGTHLASITYLLVSFLLPEVSLTRFERN